MTDGLTLGARARQWAFFMSWRLREGLVRLIVPRRAVESRGLRFTLPADNWITYYRWKTYNDKEPETLDWIDGLRGDDVLFDVGANIGLYSLYAAHRHPHMRVASFEPEYSNLHLLRDNVAENGVTERIAIYPVALGDENRLTFLHVQDLHPGAALHTVSDERTLPATRTDRPVVGREGIVQMTLDAFVEQTGLQPTCMKIDVDGNERQVLAGATTTLASPAFRSMLIELPSGVEREPCAAQLSAAGLRQTWRDPSGASQNEVWAR